MGNKSTYRRKQQVNDFGRTRGQRGMSKKNLDLIDTCREIIEPVQPITVRGVCYKLFTAGKIPSMAVKYTQQISRLLVRAREDRTIPWAWIVDDSRRMEGGGGYANLTHYGKTVKEAYSRDFWAHQSERVIVISEKATVSGIIRPVLDEYGVPFLVNHGFASATTAYKLAKQIRTDERQHIFLYVGDYDCSGMYMSEVDLPARLEEYGAADFEFKRIALTEEDVRSDDFPEPFPAKTTDRRYRWYVENYGGNAWELDAMDPNDLRNRVQQEIEGLINEEDWKQHKETEEAEQKKVEEWVTNLCT